MSRMQRTCLVVGAAAAGGATGWVLGMLYAPVPGRYLRKRLAWKSERQWKAFSHNAERFLNDVTACAAAEIARATARSGVRTS